MSAVTTAQVERAAGAWRSQRAPDGGSLSNLGSNLGSNLAFILAPRGGPNQGSKLGPNLRRGRK